MTCKVNHMECNVLNTKDVIEVIIDAHEHLLKKLDSDIAEIEQKLETLDLDIQKVEIRCSVLEKNKP